MDDVQDEAALGGFAAMLREALGDRLDPAASSFVQMMAEDAVMEFPYAPPGGPRRLEGRAAMTAHLRGLAGVIEIHRMRDLVVHRTLDPDTRILEFGCEGRGVQTGRPYDQRYISVITLRAGRIARYVDYWNPLVVLETIGGVAAISAITPSAASAS
jgi:ketosteroid isomerase-like protein